MAPWALGAIPDAARSLQADRFGRGLRAPVNLPRLQAHDGPDRPFPRALDPLHGDVRPNGRPVEARGGQRPAFDAGAYVGSAFAADRLGGRLSGREHLAGLDAANGSRPPLLRKLHREDVRSGEARFGGRPMKAARARGPAAQATGDPRGRRRGVGPGGGRQALELLAGLEADDAPAPAPSVLQDVRWVVRGPEERAGAFAVGVIPMEAAGGVGAAAEACVDRGRGPEPDGSGRLRAIVEHLAGLDAEHGPAGRRLAGMLDGLDVVARLPFRDECPMEAARCEQAASSAAVDERGVLDPVRSGRRGRVLVHLARFQAHYRAARTAATRLHVLFRMNVVGSHKIPLSEVSNGEHSAIGRQGKRA